MDLDDLRLLDTVAVQGSFSAAATKLRYSQPSVSARIAALERAVGAELFIRDARGARLTPAGSRYLSYVRRCLALIDSATLAARSEANARPLRVGVPASYAAAVARPLVAAARRIGIAVSLRSGHSPDLRTELFDELLDLMLTSPAPAPAGYQTRHAFETAVVAIARPGFDQATAGGYAVHTWGQDDSTVSGLLSEGVPRSRIALVSPASAAVHLALWNNHIGVVPEVCAREELQEGRLGPVLLSTPTAHSQLDWTYSAAHDQRQPIEDIIQEINSALATADPAAE